MLEHSYLFSVDDDIIISVCNKIRCVSFRITVYRRNVKDVYLVPALLHIYTARISSAVSNTYPTHARSSYSMPEQSLFSDRTDLVDPIAVIIIGFVIKAPTVILKVR